MQVLPAKIRAGRGKVKEARGWGNAKNYARHILNPIVQYSIRLLFPRRLLFQIGTPGRLHNLLTRLNKCGTMRGRESRQLSVLSEQQKSLTWELLLEHQSTASQSVSTESVGPPRSCPAGATDKSQSPGHSQQRETKCHLPAASFNE